MLRRLFTHISFAVVVLTGSVACSGGSGGSRAGTPVDGTNTLVPAALQFNAPLVGGGQLDGSSLAGRAVLLWFWAPT